MHVLLHIADFVISEAFWLFYGPVRLGEADIAWRVKDPVILLITPFAALGGFRDESRFALRNINVNRGLSLLLAWSRRDVATGRIRFLPFF